MGGNAIDRFDDPLPEAELRKCLAYDFRVFTVCTVIYFAYSVVCFGIMKISNVANSLFTFIASIVIVVWFIVCGLHANRDESFRGNAK